MKRHKQPIALILVDINKIVISNKFKHNDKGSKYFIGYKDDGIIRPLSIVLSQIIEYVKHIEKIAKNMSFKIEDDSVLVKYYEIWKKTKKTLGAKFHSKPVYDKK